MAAAQSIGAETLARGREKSLEWYDSEEIQWYVAVGHDLVSRSPVGYQLECARDQCHIVALPSSWPKWSRSHAARAERIGHRLLRAEQLFPGAVSILWALSHPTAVAMGGLPGRRARLVAVYPLTKTGSRARWSAAGKAGKGQPSFCELDSPRVFSLNGVRATDALRSVYANIAQSRGRMLAMWEQVDREAQELVQQATRAWVAAGDDD